LGTDRKNGTWVQGAPVDDAAIAESRLEGKRAETIATEVGLTPAAVAWRLKRIGFPGHTCRFLHGQPVSKNHFLDLCMDFGVSKKTVIKAAGGDYWSVMNHLSKLGPLDVFTVRRANSILAVRKGWTDSCCFESYAGKRVRNFLASEIRDLPNQRARLLQALGLLRAWLRTQGRNVQPSQILNWICLQSRKEVVNSNGPGDSRHGFRALMFLWPVLKSLALNRFDLLAGRRFLEEVVDQLLGQDYGAAAERIKRAASGDLTPLDSRTLGKLVQTVGPPGKKLLSRKPRGRHREREEDKSYYKIGAQVEKEIPNSLKQTKYAIIAARRRVSGRTRLSFELVAEYHKDFRRTCAKTGTPLPTGV
jgi:hypothetical protein